MGRKLCLRPIALSAIGSNILAPSSIIKPMISSKNRFHGYGSLKRVYREGQIVRGPLFALKYRPNPQRQSYRLAVVVSRKVNKSAVVRNRIRRRLYETVRQMDNQITRPYDIVLTVFHDTVREESPDRLSKQVKKQLANAGIITTSDD
jgi:ribonuclease P protein component